MVNVLLQPEKLRDTSLGLTPMAVKLSGFERQNYRVALSALIPTGGSFSQRYRTGLCYFGLPALIYL